MKTASILINQPTRYTLTTLLGDNLSERSLRALARAHGVPIAKYKWDTAVRLARHLLDTNATVTIHTPQRRRK